MVMPSIVAEEAADRFLRRFLAEPWTRRVAFSVEMFDAAQVAFRRYGRGRGHPAKLNFGDCMSYAVAKVHGIPLLYKGEDFSQTDIVSALA
ncbi:PIN domain-containing protein [Enterovirga sp. CN4-39]|uniref:PIN domain-containing protein n=1 Tax=Enterovirga sp. CN4-39 TaxID=3400910 RepID=UPI003C0AC6CF